MLKRKSVPVSEMFCGDFRIVDIDGLWLEFEKAIKFGHFKKFKTRRGFNSWLKREIRKHPGKAMIFKFNDGKGIFSVMLERTPEFMDLVMKS